MRYVDLRTLHALVSRLKCRCDPCAPKLGIDQHTTSESALEDTMKYILQMVVDESGWENLTPEQQQPMMDAQTVLR